MNAAAEGAVDWLAASAGGLARRLWSGPASPPRHRPRRRSPCLRRAPRTWPTTLVVGTCLPLLLMCPVPGTVDASLIRRRGADLTRTTRYSCAASAGKTSIATTRRHPTELLGARSLCSERARTAYRPRPDRAPARRPRGEPGAPSRAASPRPARQASDLVVFPELGLTGYLLQDLAAEVAMRLDDPRLAELARATDGMSAVVVVRRGIGRSPPVHRRRPDRGRRDPARPPQALPADLRPVRRAPLLRRGRPPAGRPIADRGRDRPGDLRGLLAPQRAPAAGPRRRPDPDQHLVVAGARPGGHERGRPRDGDVVADPDAHVRPAHDEPRRILQPGRQRRIDLASGAAPRSSPRPAARSSARRSTTRACSWSTSTLADIRRERIALPLLRDERLELAGPRAAADRRRAGGPRPRHHRGRRCRARARRGADPAIDGSLR